MIIVIDGYNVLKQSLKKIEIADQAKNQFIAQLNRYGKKKNHAIVVVFDGGMSIWPDTEKIGIVTVVHSGTRESADDYIKRYLDEHKNKELLLVSTDRAIGQHAWDLGIESLDAIDFYMLLQEEIASDQNNHPHAPQQKIMKLTEREYPELDELMRQASKTVMPKKEVAPAPEPRQQRTGQTVSKKERPLAMSSRSHVVRGKNVRFLTDPLPSLDSAVL